MNYDTFLFAGHGLASTTNTYDPGATYNNHVEAEYTKKIVSKALEYLKPLNILIHNSENNFTDKDTKNNIYKYKAGLSIHINAGKGTGTEIIVPLNEKYLTPDDILCKSISATLGIPNRGLKSRDYNTGEFIQRTNGTAITGVDYYGEIRTAWQDGISLSILEVGFIDTNDINLINNNIENISYLIACYIAEICTQSLPNISNNYKVIISDLHIKEEAEGLLKEFKCRGYNSTLETY